MFIVTYWAELSDNAQLPVAWIIAFLPHIYAAQLSNLYDNCSPRTYPELVEKDQTLDKAVFTSSTLLRPSLSNHHRLKPAFFAPKVRTPTASKTCPSLRPLSLQGTSPDWILQPSTKSAEVILWVELCITWSISTTPPRKLVPRCGA